MKLLTVDTLEEARTKLLNCLGSRKPAVEHLDPRSALGRVLAEDLYSPEAVPPFRRSTVDGYAVAAADTAGAGESLPVFLTRTSAVEMGKTAACPLSRGQCAYVPTGGMIPEGADAVVMLEYSEPFGEGIAIYTAAAAGSHVAEAGEDMQQGELLLCRGVKIGPREAGVLAAAGIREAPVYAPLDITLISTGDELVPPDTNPGPGEIRDINTSALRALAIQSGYRIISELVLNDDESALERAVRDALPRSDVVAVSGGSSQGEKDYTAAVIARFAKPDLLTRGLALKPGKPTILGYDAASKTILAGLPGHPVSALIVFQLILSWLYGALTGGTRAFPIPARITSNIPGSPGKTSCQPVRLRQEETGYTAEPVFGKSGMITTLTRADGYIIIDMNTEGLKKDEPVWVYLL